MSSNNLDQDQVTLARSLAHPTDKPLRDRTVKSLKEYLSSITAVSELNMLKLWKALYYCMWLCDKVEIQEDLAKQLTEYIHIFRKHKLTVLYIQIFCRTIQREWSLLDQHRVNKFYLFYRHMLREIFGYVFEKKFSRKSIRSILQVVDDEILQKTPNGLRFHTADIYVDELFATASKHGVIINTKDFIALMAPFLRIIKKSSNSILVDRLIQGILDKYITKYAAKTIEEDSIHAVDTKILQAIVFDMAGAEDTNEGTRKKLYAMHKLYQNVTKEEFVELPDEFNIFVDEDDSMEIDESTTMIVKETEASADQSESMKDKKGDKKSHKRKLHDIQSHDNDLSKSVKLNSSPMTTIQTTDKKEEKQPDQKETKKMKKETSIDHTPSKKSTAEAVSESPEKSNAVKKVSTPKAGKTQEQAVASTKKADKEEKSYEVNVKNIEKKKDEVIEKVSNNDSKAEEPSKPNFIASKSFVGSKPGYAFKKVSTTLLAVYYMHLVEFIYFFHLLSLT